MSEANGFNENRALQIYQLSQAYAQQAELQEIREKLNSTLERAKSLGDTACCEELEQLSEQLAEKEARCAKEIQLLTEVDLARAEDRARVFRELWTVDEVFDAIRELLQREDS